MSFGNFLGYRRGVDGTPEIVPKEADTVRKIYRLFLEGSTYGDIARQLMEEGITSPRKNKEWPKSTIKSILSNERYKGDALLQKRFTIDFLNKKTKANEGEVPQYYVENSHPAIVSKDVFDLVQHEIRKRSDKSRMSSSRHCFSSKLRCECCGNYFGSKVWHSTDKYRKALWQCNHKFKNGTKCSTPHTYETELLRIGLEVENQLIKDREAIINTCASILDSLFGDKSLDQKRQSAEEEFEKAHLAMATFVDENKWKLADQIDYQKRFDELEAIFNNAKGDYEQADQAVKDRTLRKHLIDQFLATLADQAQILTNFDETLWSVTVDEVLVKQSGELVINLKTGQQIIKGMR